MNNAHFDRLYILYKSKYESATKINIGYELTVEKIHYIFN